LIANELPLSYLDEVVKFIEKNTAGVQLGAGSYAGDPYTGAGAYRPGANSSNAPTTTAAPTPEAAPAASTSSNVLPYVSLLAFYPLPKLKLSI